MNDDLLRRGEVVVQGDAVKARQVANQIALRRAVEQYGVQRIFTFHSSVASASSFIGPGGEGVNSELPDFVALHVNGKLTAATREHILQEFAQADKAVISNARCLTEGVDLPAVDMVAFMSPKKSKVDIVQATGRAMRKAAYKTAGYVLVPLFVEKAAGEDIEHALERTGFDEVWNVLEAMREQDDVLADVIREMREDKGKVPGYDDSRFREHVEVLGLAVSLDALRNGITTLCIEALGSTWDERFGELTTYKERFGNCDVPRIYPYNLQLGMWVQTQRSARREGRLSEERIKRLEDLGFVWWGKLKTKWEEMFSALEEYKKEHGYNDKSILWYPKSQKLANWIAKQNVAKCESKLSEEQLQRLEALGFSWDKSVARWEEMFSALEDYQNQYGHCRVLPSENWALAGWVKGQHVKQLKGKLGAERTERLEALGFAWDNPKANWEEMFSALEDYQNQHGHCFVLRSQNRKLASWARTQRVKMRNGTLSNGRIQRLEALGFEWFKTYARWEDVFTALESYQYQHGHCNVQKSENEMLASWTETQRVAMRKGRLSKERVQRLEALGFEWSRR